MHPDLIFIGTPGYMYSNNFLLFYKILIEIVIETDGIDLSIPSNSYYFNNLTNKDSRIDF